MKVFFEKEKWVSKGKKWFIFLCFFIESFIEVNIIKSVIINVGNVF